MIIEREIITPFVSIDAVRLFGSVIADRSIECFDRFASMSVNILCGISYRLLTCGIKKPEQVNQISLHFIGIKSCRKLFPADLIRFNFSISHKIIPLFFLIIRCNLFLNILIRIFDQISRLINDCVGYAAFILSIDCNACAFLIIPAVGSISHG